MNYEKQMIQDYTLLDEDLISDFQPLILSQKLQNRLETSLSHMFTGQTLKTETVLISTYLEVSTPKILNALDHVVTAILMYFQKMDPAWSQHILEISLQVVHTMVLVLQSISSCVEKKPLKNLVQDIL